jgi:putative PIN family toxin of toxin-antitoxin system
MNLVLDTNVLVSALLSPFHAPGRILDLLLASKIKLVYDDRILAEYRAVLLRPKFGFDHRSVEDLLGECVTSGLPVVAPPINLNLPDPSDVVFVEVAAVAGAPLVTGNGRHFPPDRCAGVAILSPAAFLEQWQQQQSNE